VNQLSLFFISRLADRRGLILQTMSPDENEITVRPKDGCDVDPATRIELLRQDLNRGRTGRPPVLVLLSA
jgi:hypothetical protein